MKVLILTNPKFVEFVLQVVEENSMGTDFIVRSNGKYDWSEDYDIGVSFMYQYRVPKEQLHKTWINFHPAPLPEYGGRNLCYHALMNGEKEFGTSVHYIDEGFDTGRIIEVVHFLIRDNWCADDLSWFTFEQSKILFQEYLPRICKEEVFYSVENVGGKYYEKVEIPEYITISKVLESQIRAITYNDFSPKIDIGGVTFKVVREV